MTLRHALLVVCALETLTATAIAAQDERTLRSAFEGKAVTLRIAMPATDRGIDVFPQQQPAVDWREVSERTKDFGSALKIGEQTMITRVVVKKSHIEFQLGGGGWGTFGDSPGTSSVTATIQSETKAERALRDSVRSTPRGALRTRLERDLRELQDVRERENDVARAAAAQANAAHEANVRARRAESGSRFNIRYRDAIPGDQLTPEAVRSALADYVDFGNGTTFARPSNSGAANGGSGASRVRKGLLLREVEALLGPATSASELREGTLTVLKRVYVADGFRIQTSFVNDVLIDFTMSPR
jgi:hypothetical protein